MTVEHTGFEATNLFSICHTNMARSKERLKIIESTSVGRKAARSK